MLHLGNFSLFFYFFVFLFIYFMILRLFFFHSIDINFIFINTAATVFDLLNFANKNDEKY